MRFSNIEALESFVEEVDECLLSSENQKEIDYPFDYVSPWIPEVLLEANKDLLSSVANNASVYAIFAADNNSTDYTLRYIGKTTKKLARERLKNHLIKKDEQTGAKLNKVKEQVQGGGTIKISWVGLEPESLRNYVEEELIKKHDEAIWNRENA